MIKIYSTPTCPYCVTLKTFLKEKGFEFEEIPIEGVFVEIGSAPSLHFLGGLVEYNQKNELIINLENNMSSCQGIFGAGDTTNIPYKQIIIAASEGAKAALAAYNYLAKTANS